MAALTFVDISGALIGAFSAIAIFVILALKSKIIIEKVPLRRLRLISGVLFAITAISLIVYGVGLHAPGWVHWIIPPLQ